MAEQGEFERTLRQLVGDQVNVGLATVVAPVPNPFNPLLTPLVQVLLQPGSILAEVRLVSVGQGPGQGLFFPVTPGAEVLVLYPEGRPDDGVALYGLSSGANVAPLPTDGAGAVLMSLLGVVIRSGSGLPASAIVKGDLLTGGPPGLAPPTGGLATWILALEVFLQALAISVPTAAGAVAAFNGSTGATPATPSPFAAALLVSANPATAGGPPHASLLNKVTD